MSYTCLVCNKPFEGPKCPRCNFRAVEIVADYQNTLKKMEPRLQAERQRFYGKVTIGVMILRWKDQDGYLVLDRRDKVVLGTAWELWNQEGWNPNQVARIPEKEEIEVTLYVDYPTYSKTEEVMTSHEISVKIPNLLKAELQQIGIRVHENNTFTVLLRNNGGEQSESQPVSLFAD